MAVVIGEFQTESSRRLGSHFNFEHENIESSYYE